MVARKAERKAPAVTIRFRSKTELAKIKRAAKLQERSFNNFAVQQLALAADGVIAQAEPLPTTEQVQ